VAVANPSDREEIVCKVEIPHAQQLSLVTPEAPDPKPFSGDLRVPAESAAVLLEL
jgi:hypothetical protein